MSTQFKAVLKYLGEELSKEDKKEAILTYFGNEGSEEFTIGDEDYYVFDEYDLKELLRDQYKEDCQDFKKTLWNSSYIHIVEFIDFGIIVNELVEELNYDHVRGYQFLESIGKFYIYTKV